MDIKSKRTKSKAKKITKYLRSLDAYGHQINLTYKNDSTFKTLFGGIITIATRAFIFFYFIMEFENVIQR